MTVLERQGRPATLQVDAIALRLQGSAMVAEVVRYLRAEFPHFEWLGAFRRDGAELVSLADADDPGPGPPPFGAEFEGLTVKTPSEPPTRSVDPRGPGPWLVLPVRSGAELLGALVAHGNPGAVFDSSDRRFLEGVAGRLGPALTAPVGTRLL